MNSKVTRVYKCVLGVLTLAFAVGSCGKVAEPDEPSFFDSNTNWLQRCVDDDQCTGSLRCYCGICTKPCGQDTECRLLSGAECAESGDALCGEQASAGGLCVLGCTEASACGAGFDCALGQCVPKPCEAQPGMDWDDVYQAINSDLERADPDDQQFLRYFMLGSGSGDSDSAGACGLDRVVQRQALFKLVNSLSLGADIAEPVPIDVDESVYRIDLRDYDWDIPARITTGEPGNRFQEFYTDVWEALVANNRFYALPFVGDDADDARADTGTQVPVLLVDAFVAAATTPPVYYGALGIALRFEELALEELGIDPDSTPTFSAGYTEETEYLAQYWPTEVRAGYLWSIADLGREPGTLFSDPLLEPLGERELIFTLPNGLHAFAFMNGNGERVDSWSVTQDLRAVGRVARAPRANLRRHPGRVNLRDEVRDELLANPDRFNSGSPSVERQRFPGPEELELLLERDYDTFVERALRALGLDPDAPEPILQVVEAFERSVTLEVAAAELMVTPKELRDNLLLLDPQLTPLRTGSVSRTVFTSLYAQSVCILSTVLENQPLPELCS